MIVSAAEDFRKSSIKPLRILKKDRIVGRRFQKKNDTADEKS